jgi:hypothetical protein
VVEERWRYTKKLEKLFGQIETDRIPAASEGNATTA